MPVDRHIIMNDIDIPKISNSLFPIEYLLVAPLLATINDCIKKYKCLIRFNIESDNNIIINLFNITNNIKVIF
jgi:hypothetical protein